MSYSEQKSLSVLRKKWAVAELKISYRAKKRTGVEITSTEQAHKVFREMWDKSLLNVQEQLCALFLNHNNEVLGFRIISTGKLSKNTIDNQLLLSSALLSRCSKIIIAHNHPSGKVEPSLSDQYLTWNIKYLCESFDFAIIDHIIISESDYYSFSDHGLIFK